MEVNRPEIDPQLVAEDIAEQLQKRASFRRTMKRAIDTTMEAGAKGIRIQMAGRLGGSEMARTESNMAGSIPLSTLRAKIEYGFAEAKTAQGHIGIKVWINNGDYLSPSRPESAAASRARSGSAARLRETKRRIKEIHHAADAQAREVPQDAARKSARQRHAAATAVSSRRFWSASRSKAVGSVPRPSRPAVSPPRIRCAAKAACISVCSRTSR